jgi:hypothetical protein
MARRGSAKKRSPPHILADKHFEPIRNPPAADPGALKGFFEMSSDKPF